MTQGKAGQCWGVECGLRKTDMVEEVLRSNVQTDGFATIGRRGRAVGATRDNTASFGVGCGKTGGVLERRLS